METIWITTEIIKSLLLNELLTDLSVNRNAAECNVQGQRVLYVILREPSLFEPEASGISFCMQTKQALFSGRQATRRAAYRACI